MYVGEHEWNDQAEVKQPFIEQYDGRYAGLFGPRLDFLLWYLVIKPELFSFVARCVNAPAANFFERQ